MFDSRSPSTPDVSLLTRYAPVAAWQAARDVAARSTLLRYRVGASVYDPTSGRVLACGYAQGSADAPGTHAEVDAVTNTPGDPTGLTVVIWAQSARSGGHAWSSCPCGSCARTLAERGIAACVYSTLDARGVWQVRVERPQALMMRASSLVGPYARRCRVAPLWAPPERALARAA